jgi:Ca-activated chloride channel family protein
MAEFHFERPLWLLLLPVGVVLALRLLRGREGASGWSAVVEAPLRAFVLAAPAVLRESRWPLLAAAAAWLLAVVALAGPAWERVAVPAFRSDEALVVALDLSRSMDAEDLEPSRLTRAKLKLLDLLERRSAGQTALVVFTTHAFTVTPLTTDTRTIGSLIGALQSDIMPAQGSSVRAALEKAAALLAQTGLTRGEVLLITDAAPAAEELDLAEDLRADGVLVHVLGAGTEEGAPIPQTGGGFVTDASGRVVVPRLEEAPLRELAARGGGRYARLAPDDRDLDALFPVASALPGGGVLEEEGEQAQQADVWRDQGVWLAVALLPLLALGFRRGWIGVLLACFLVPAPRAQAFEWSQLWQRPDQRGYDELQKQNAARAAELFEDPEWRGAAQFRAGDYLGSAVTLDRLDTPEAHYNRGNALAKAGRVEPAIAAYDRALELDPSHEDARHNRDLLEDFLEKNPEQRQQPPQQQNGNGSNDAAESQSQASAGEGEQAEGEQGEQQDPSDGQQASADESQSEGEGSQDSPQSPEDSQADGEQRSEEPGAEEQQGETQQASAAGPEDVEQWASEQAAEQWLRRIPQDPGGLLRRKFLYQYQRLGIDQDGNPVAPNGGADQW